jgi:hypothetical protein
MSSRSSFAPLSFSLVSRGVLTVQSLNFVVCPAYHGATFVSLLLNNHSRITSLGDTIPARRHLDGNCSCGSVIRSCPFWSTILETTDFERFRTGDKVLPLWPRLADVHQSLNRAVAIAFGAAANILGASVWSLVAKRRNEYVDVYERFHATVKRLHGTDVFIDGSKSMSKTFVLASILPQAEVRVLHLVRDPRDYHCSHMKNRPDSASLRSSARGWRNRHLAILGMVRLMRGVRYLRVRYEDLCDDPEKTLSSVYELFGVEYEDVFHAPQDPLKNHVIGSRSKSRFDGTIRASRGWRERLTPTEAATIARLARPLFHPFGYR